MFEIILTIQIISILLVFTESVYILAKWKTRLQGLLFFYCVAVFVNNMGYLFEMLSDSEEAYYRSLQMSYMGRVWIPFSLLLFVLNFCKIKYDKKLIGSLAVVHVCTYLLMVTSDYNDLYYTTKTYITGDWFDYCKFGHGPWYKIYEIMIMGYIIYGISAIIIKLRKESNPLAKKRISLVLASVGIVSVAFILNAILKNNCYDLTACGYSLGTFVMLIAIFKFDLMHTLEAARDYVVDEISEAFIICDVDGNLEYVNKKTKSIFDDRILNNQFVDMIEKSYKKQTPIFFKDRVFVVNKECIQRENRQADYVYVINDYTEQYNYMQELKEQTELAVAANNSKSAFLSVVSHEIRTPMNAVVGMTDILLRDEDNLNDNQVKYLKNIRNSGKALVMIVNDILDQSKIEAGKMEIVEDKYEIRPMLDDIRMIIEERIGNKPIDFDVEIPDTIPSVLIGDSLRIRQILINLCNNAVKFTEEGFIKLILSVVEEDAGKENMNIRFDIKDSGLGIKPEDLKKLGEAFTQVDTQKNHSKEGTGLGLSISKNFISMMGGQLKVDSVYGKGSDFYFSINQKIIKEDEIKESEEIKKQAWQEELQFICPDMKLLVVDDTDINLLVFREIIKPLKASVTTADSGKKALELINDNTYDLIFMDYMMPVMDGIETTAKIREAGVRTPIIALSADESKDSREKFIEAGMDDSTQKPIVVKNIKECLYKWAPDKCEKTPS